MFRTNFRNISVISLSFSYSLECWIMKRHPMACWNGEQEERKEQNLSQFKRKQAETNVIAKKKKKRGWGDRGLNAFPAQEPSLMKKKPAYFMKSNIAQGLWSYPAGASAQAGICTLKRFGRTGWVQDASRGSFQPNRCTPGPEMVAKENYCWGASVAGVSTWQTRPKYRSLSRTCLMKRPIKTVGPHWKCHIQRADLNLYWRGHCSLKTVTVDEFGLTQHGKRLNQQG